VPSARTSPTPTHCCLLTPAQEDLMKDDAGGIDRGAAPGKHFALERVPPFRIEPRARWLARPAASTNAAVATSASKRRAQSLYCAVMLSAGRHASMEARLSSPRRSHTPGWSGSMSRRRGPDPGGRNTFRRASASSFGSERVANGLKDAGRAASSRGALQHRTFCRTSASQLHFFK
jgi:hypothetical protein